jgi:DNA-directed RNA polymerase specialized sigma24 family protein
MHPAFHTNEPHGSSQVRLSVSRPIFATGEVNARVFELVERGETSAAISLLLEQHGADVFGVLVGVLDDMRAARATYKAVVGRLPVALPTFEWRCSPRVWLYSLAHNELREHQNRATTNETDPVDDTAVRGLITVIAAVRRELTEEERELLILHLDRGLDWSDLAYTQLGDAAVSTTLVDEVLLLQRRMTELVERIKTLATEQLER